MAYDKANPPETFVIPLRKPVTLGSETYTQLQLREPTGAEWELFDKQGHGPAYDITAVSLVSGVPRPAVALIGTRDLILAAGYIGSFLADGQSTGVSD